MTSTKVSIITAIYNAEQYLDQALQSICNQSYKNIEIIVIDGGSTDRSMSIVDKFSHNIDVKVSEKDNGIYDAWNKGVALATGDVIGFCNGDDYLAVDAIEKALSVIDLGVPSLVYGDVQLLDEITGHSYFEAGSFLPAMLYRGFGFRTTTVFFNRMALDVNGAFNESYRIAGDSDWLLRAYGNNVLFLYGANLTYMRLGGVSNLYEAAAFMEYCMALYKHSLFGYKSLFVLLKKYIKKFVRKASETAG